MGVIRTLGRLVNTVIRLWRSGSQNGTMHVCPRGPRAPRRAAEDAPEMMTPPRAGRDMIGVADLEAVTDDIYNPTGLQARRIGWRFLAIPPSALAHGAASD